MLSDEEVATTAPNMSGPSSMNSSVARPAYPRGPLPTGIKYKGIPVPPHFCVESAEAFSKMEIREDDVVVLCPVLGAVGWLKGLLDAIVYGEKVEETEKSWAWLELLELGETPDGDDHPAPSSFRALEAQRPPRVFFTHLIREDLLPPQLLRIFTGREDILHSLHSTSITRHQLPFFSCT